MVLLKMIFRKILKNKWLVSCLLLGLIISVALISSIPMYAEGILQRLLIKELEEYQQKNNKFPGIYQAFFYANDDDIRELLKELKEKREQPLKNEKILEHYRKRLKSFEEIDRYMSDKVPGMIGLPVLNSVVTYSIDIRKIISEDVNRSKSASQHKFAKLESVRGLENHVKLIDGRLPEKTPKDGVYEVLVSEWALKKLDIVKDRVFTLEDPTDIKLEPIKVKPVGVFTVEADKDPFWSLFNTQIFFRESFLIDESMMRKHFIERDPTLVYSARWNYAFDYHALTINNLGRVVGGHNKITKDLNGIFNNISIDAPGIFVITTYFEKEARLKNMLWVLNVPVIIMLFLYLFMVSRLIIERERNEIALLSSRGANRYQIVTGYLVEGLVLGGSAFITGPWLGMILSRILGASSGFLEFAKRKALPVYLNESVFKYAVLAVGVSLFTMLIPAYFASRTSIVSHKQSISRRSMHATWERVLLDIVFIVLAGYGYYTFMQRQETLRVTGVSALDIQIDPFLFIVPTLFILGTGLLFLRLYPWFVKGIYWIGKRVWPPSMYVTLTQIGRMFKSYHFLMVFLVMTLSTGIFSATAARTINRNAEEKIFYSAGADMVIEELWENDAPKGGGGPAGTGEAEKKKDGSDEEFTVKRINYFEPSFLRYTQLSGVEHAAKVFNVDKAFIETNGKYAENVKLMGIESYDFGKVAWFRNGLMAHHINEYLNLLTAESSACLISKSVSEAYGIRRGDSVKIGWKGNNSAIFNVYGIIDYWPAWNPNKDPMKPEEGEPMLVVANLSYIQNHLGMEPYEVWLKLKPGATSRQVYESITEKKIRVLSLTDARQQIIQVRNSPFQLALNGVLTLGFVISGIICLLGFLIYWVLSINSRVLQFGIFRAMGLSVSKLISMMIWEQLLTSGAAVFSGIMIGLVSSRVFVPFFQIVFDAYTQVPPFKVISYSSDRVKIYLLVAFMLVTGLSALGFLISRIKISQAIKLGEE